jgi:5-methylcytosine-specific restriction endonuclease McrA
MRAVILERNRKWLAANPERGIMYAQRRRARDLGAEGTHTIEDVAALWESQGHKCAVPGCTRPIHNSGPNRYTIDHIQPLTKGGTNYPWNLQILCKSHNSEKHNSDPYEWAQSVGLLFL